MNPDKTLRCEARPPPDAYFVQTPNGTLYWPSQYIAALELERWRQIHASSGRGSVSELPMLTNDSSTAPDFSASASGPFTASAPAASPPACANQTAVLDPSSAFSYPSMVPLYRTAFPALNAEQFQDLAFRTLQFPPKTFHAASNAENGCLNQEPNACLLYYMPFSSSSPITVSLGGTTLVNPQQVMLPTPTLSETEQSMDAEVQEDLLLLGPSKIEAGIEDFGPSQEHHMQAGSGASFEQDLVDEKMHLNGSKDFAMQPDCSQKSPRAKATKKPTQSPTKSPGASRTTSSPKKNAAPNSPSNNPLDKIAPRVLSSTSQSMFKKPPSSLTDQQLQRAIGSILQRRSRNTEAARRSRERRQEQLHDLEDSIAVLEAQNRLLREKMQSLQSMVKAIGA